MLNFFRRRDTATRFVLGGFLVLICVAMVMFLIPQGTSDNSSLPVDQQTVATVDGTAITGQQVSQQLAQFANGQQIPNELVPVLGQQVLHELVVQQAMVDQARRLGLVPTDPQIVAAAQAAMPQLYPNGKYVGDTQAAQMLAAQGLSLSQFQTMLRDNLMAAKIHDLVTDPIRIGASEAYRRFQQQNETAVFDYVRLDPATMQAAMPVTPAALAAYYARHQAAYQSPERRKVEVVLANLTALAAQIPISSSAVDSYYQQHIADFSHPEEVKVAHILIKYPDSTPTPAQVAATRAKAAKVLKLVRADPANFAALAKQYSEDDASATQGGELGFIQRNQTVPAFEKVAFSLPVGQISGLVQTEYGFHIIKVEAHQQASVQPESAVHDQIVSQLQQDQAANLAQRLINQAGALAAATPLSQVAAQLKLQYFQTAPISRTDPVAGIGVNPNFAQAVFSTPAGGVTPPVQVAQGYALAKVDQIVPPGPQPLSAVQPQVSSDYQLAQAKKLAQSQAQQLARTAATQGLAAAAAQLHLTVKTSPALTRAGSLPDGAAISSFAGPLFALKPSQVGPVATVGGAQLVYQLVSLQQPTAVQFAQQQAQFTSTLLDNRRSSAFSAYADALVASLTKAGRIQLHPAALQRVLGADFSTGGNS